MESIDAGQLFEGVGDESADAGLSLHSELEPLGGFGAPVKPAVYEGGTYQLDQRWWGGGDTPVPAVVIDNTPSQANRAEAALAQYRERLGLPVLVLDLGAAGGLPAHVPDQLTSFEFPHRHADAYLRDAVLADSGTRFLDCEIGRSLLGASATRPIPLLEWMPHSFLYGFWQSHMGKKGVQTKFARAVEAEIVGYRPAAIDTRRLGVKGDPLNLTVDSALRYEQDDQTTWELTTGAKVGKSRSKDSLAEIGHGQVPISRSDAPLGSVSFQAIEQRCTISFSRLRTIDTGDPESAAAARALLAALALVGCEGAFARGFTLRSGCDLRPVRRNLVWRTGAGDVEMAPPGIDGALALFDAVVERAAKLGLPVGPSWATDPVRLRPSENLLKVIRSTFALPSR